LWRRLIGALVGTTAFGAITASWLAPIDASWTAPAAWSSNPAYPDNGQPNPGDLYNAVIAAVGAPYNVSLASDITISGLTLNSADATLAQSDGTLRLVDGGATISAGTYLMSGGTLSSDDTISIASRFDWNGGTLSGFGVINVGATGSINLGTQSASRGLSRQINNSGTINFTSGVTVLSNGTINNQAGGVMNFSAGNAFLIGSGSNNLIRNSGVMNFDPAGSGFFTAPLLNNGTINIDSGSLQFGAGTFTHNSGARITGPGFVDLGHREQIRSSTARSRSLAETSISALERSRREEMSMSPPPSTGTAARFTGSGTLTIKPNAVLMLGPPPTHDFSAALSTTPARSTSQRRAHAGGNVSEQSSRRRG
jgi:hypothetical protein